MFNRKSHPTDIIESVLPQTDDSSGSFQSGDVMVAGGMEAAKSYDGGLEDWYGTEGSIDPEVIAEKSMVDARIVNAINNDVFARKAFNFVKQYVVGQQFKLNAKPAIHAMPPEYDKVWLKIFKKEVQELFGLWANSDNNWVDYTRRKNLSQLLQLGVGIFYTTGELFIKVEWSDDPKLPYKTQLQVLNGRRIKTPLGKTEGVDNITAGIEKNETGAIIAYHVIGAIEGEETANHSALFTSVRVPAETSFGRKNMIHVMKEDYPGQTRGISQIVSVLMTMRMLKDFDKFALTQASIQASIAATIESDLPAHEVQTMMKGPKVDEDSGWLGKYSSMYFSVVKDWKEKLTKKFEINRSKIIHLVPGSKLVLNALGSSAGIGVDFPTRFLRHLAVGLGVSYEQLSNDYTRTNFSSAKAAMNETHRVMSDLKKIVADHVAGAVYKLWLEEALHKGDIPCMRGRKFNLYSGLFFDALANCVWIGPARPSIDAIKEAQANTELLRTGQITREMLAAKNGEDWEDMADQLEIERDVYKEKGLTHDQRLDNNPRMSEEEDSEEYAVPGNKPKPKPKPKEDDKDDKK